MRQAQAARFQARAQPEVGRATPGAFRAWLLRRYATGQLSAKAVCAAASAVRGHGLGVEDLINSSSTHAQRVLDQSLHLNEFVEENVYYVDVPVKDHRTGARRVRKHPLLLPHERVAAMARACRKKTATPSSAFRGFVTAPYSSNTDGSTWPF